MTEALPYPRNLNHIGVGVADIDAAIAWYTSVLGFTVIAEPFEINRDMAHDGDMAADVLGDRFRSMRMAHLVSGNGIGFELFQLTDPAHERREPTLEFWKNGFFHICITDPDIEGLSRRIAETGGRQRSAIWNCRADSDRFKMVYCEDPFGNIIEIYTHGYERLIANRQ